MRGLHAPLADFNATHPEFITKTPIATIWKVNSPHGPAALKLYHKPTMGEERHGFTLMAALNGQGAAKVFQTTQNAALTEWLSGPHLGDLTRSGQDNQATVELVKVATTLHKNIQNIPNLPTLTQRFRALKTIRLNCPDAAKHNLQRAQILAAHLLKTQTDIRPLHGDLHHDNIRLSPRGYLAFDAKGLIGERDFELANAFRNPVSAEPLHRNPTRIRHLAQSWGQAFAVPPQRLLDWAAAKCALSIAWRSGGTVKDDPEFDLLAALLETKAQNYK